MTSDDAPRVALPRGFALREAQPAEEAKGQVENFMKARRGTPWGIHGAEGGSRSVLQFEV